MISISFKPVKAYELQGVNGPVTMTEVGTWNSLTELRDQQGRRLIVELPSSLTCAMAEASQQSGIAHMTIVSCTPELLLDLVVKCGKAGESGGNVPQPDPVVRC